jgi:hypothetical protein
MGITTMVASIVLSMVPRATARVFRVSVTYNKAPIRRRRTGEVSASSLTGRLPLKGFVTFGEGDPRLLAVRPVQRTAQSRSAPS